MLCCVFLNELIGKPCFHGMFLPVIPKIGFHGVVFFQFLHIFNSEMNIKGNGRLLFIGRLCVGNVIVVLKHANIEEARLRQTRMLINER